MPNEIAIFWFKRDLRLFDNEALFEATKNNIIIPLYNLWQDWRHFAPYLGKLFIDYEPGIHYSQIQMQSGVTGINSIRIYSPLKQSVQHDKDGKFIKRYIPELKNVPLQYIHEPHLTPEIIAKDLNIKYPKPIIDLEISGKTAK